jgi:serine/threonine protein kinase
VHIVPTTKADKPEGVPSLNGHDKTGTSRNLDDLAGTLAFALAVVQGLKRAAGEGSLPDHLKKLLAPNGSDVDEARLPDALRVLEESISGGGERAFLPVDDDAFAPAADTTPAQGKRIDLTLVPEIPVLEPTKVERARLSGYEADYEVISKLEEDEFGEKLLGRDRATRADVVIHVLNKVIDDRPTYLEHVGRVLTGLAKLDHPALVNVRAHGAHQGNPYFVTEAAPGKILSDIIGHDGRMPESDVLRLCAQLADALQHVNDKAQLSHGELRPSSIIVAGSTAGEVGFGENASMKITDFIRPLTPWHDRERLSPMATPLYVAPERLTGTDQYAVRCDIYAIGAIMYRLLTGVAPYTGTPDDVRAGHLEKPVPDPGDIVPMLSPLTRDLVRRSLSKNHEERFLSYRGFVVACQKAFKALTGLESGMMRIVRKQLKRTATSTFAKAPTLSSDADLDQIRLPNAKKTETPAEAAARERTKAISQVYHFMAMGVSDAFNAPSPLALAEARRLQEVIGRIVSRYLAEKQAKAENGNSEGKTTRLFRKIDRLLNKGKDEEGEPSGEETIKKISTRIIRSNLKQRNAKLTSKEEQPALDKRPDSKSEKPIGDKSPETRDRITWSYRRPTSLMHSILVKAKRSGYVVAAAVISVGIGLCLAGVFTGLFKSLGA